MAKGLGDLGGPIGKVDDLKNNAPKLDTSAIDNTKETAGNKLGSVQKPDLAGKSGEVKDTAGSKVDAVKETADSVQAPDAPKPDTSAVDNAKGTAGDKVDAASGAKNTIESGVHQVVDTLEAHTPSVPDQNVDKSTALGDVHAHDHVDQ